jgi:hypothetical protein
MNKFRAEKTSTNRDDLRVLLIGTIISVLMMTIIPFAQAYYDVHYATRPFVSAQTIEIVPVNGSEFPMIKYDADANQAVDATWIATTEFPDDDKHGPINLRSGPGSYSIKEDGPKMWTWDSWFDDGKSSIIPEVPNFPFKVCVRYVSVSKRSNVTDESPRYCSKIYNPLTKK